MNTLIDTHVHLTDPPYESETADVLEQCSVNGVSPLLVPGYDTESCLKIIELKRTHPSIWAAAGIHPMYITADVKIEELLVEVHNSIKLRAIGEIGFDNRTGAPSPELQTGVFRKQLELAREWNLPVIIHCVHAHVHCLDVLRDFFSKPVDEDSCVGVIHRVSCSAEIAALYAELGFCFSLGPDIFDVKRTRLQKLVRWIPLTRVLLETDAPYARKRDLSVCNPWELVLVLEYLAAIREIPVAELADIIVDNTYRLFGD